MKIINYQHYRMVDLIGSQIALDRGYKYQYHTSWEVSGPDAVVKALDKFNVIYHHYETGSACLLVDFDNALAFIEDNKSNGSIRVEVQTDNYSIIEKVIAALKNILPEGNEPKTNEISVKFWYNSTNGPKNVHRNIVAPQWPELEGNYTKHTEEGLNHLMNKFRPTSSGKLILWHGEPGTGKTYALRALCQAWKEWCTVEYIMDPEILLGSSPGYLATLIMNASNEYDDDEDEMPANGKWKLLVMEDTGELLTEDARLRSGQGLSRLLNVVDGFIGQGLRVLILITTNEEFDKLHPAVSREGRCAASIKFDGLSSTEAEHFVKRHTGTHTPLDRYSSYKIADLYAQVNGMNRPRDTEGIKRNGLGFRIPESAQKN